jgi:hypothetical protein
VEVREVLFMHFFVLFVQEDHLTLVVDNLMNDL